MTTIRSQRGLQPFQVVDFKNESSPKNQGYECETTSGGCPVKRLRMALAEADALLRQHEAMTQEYEHLKTLLAWRDKAVQVVAELTPRQHEIMELVLIGTASKNIAADLHISQRTVENHRAAIMKKTHSKGLPALGRIGFAATLHEQCCTENGSERARVP